MEFFTPASTRRDLLGLLYQGNLLDRAEPVRNMIGALALARLLDMFEHRTTQKE
jgi:hypothetical protein